MRTWLCLSLLVIKWNNRNSSSPQFLASCGIESSASSSMNETTAALYATAILFLFLNLACDSVDALFNFAPAVTVTVHRISCVPLMQLCDFGSQILIRILPKERTLHQSSVRAYLHGTTGLWHELFRVNQTYNSLTTLKSCRRPVVSLSHATKSCRVNRPLHDRFSRTPNGTLFGSQIVLSMRKKMVKDNSLSAKVGYFKFWIQLSNRQCKIKFRVAGTLKFFENLFRKNLLFRA